MSDPLDGYTTTDPLDADAAEALEPMLTATGQVVRATETRDAAGGTSRAWANHGSAVACHLWQQRAMAIEGTAQGRLQAEQTWFAALPAGTDVTAKDRFTSGGYTYEVTDTDAGRTMPGLLVLQLRRLT